MELIENKENCEIGAGDCPQFKKNVLQELKSDSLEEFGPNLKLLPSNDQVRELQTILRDR